MASCRLSSVACVSSASSRKDAAWAHPDFRPFPSPYTPTPTQTIIRRSAQEGDGGEIEEGEVHGRGEGPRVLGAIGLNRRCRAYARSGHDASNRASAYPLPWHLLCSCLHFCVCVYGVPCSCVCSAWPWRWRRPIPPPPHHSAAPWSTHTQTRHTLGQLASWQLERSDSFGNPPELETPLAPPLPNPHCLLPNPMARCSTLEVPPTRVRSSTRSRCPGHLRCGPWRTTPPHAPPRQAARTGPPTDTRHTPSDATWICVFEDFQSHRLQWPFAGVGLRCACMRLSARRSISLFELFFELVVFTFCVPLVWAMTK